MVSPASSRVAWGHAHPYCFICFFLKVEGILKTGEKIKRIKSQTSPRQQSPSYPPDGAAPEAQQKSEV